MDIYQSYEDSDLMFKRLRRELCDIRTYLRRLLRGVKRANVQRRGFINALIASVSDLLKQSDCKQQFLLCEVGKLAEIIYNGNQRYTRGQEGIGADDDDYLVI